MQGSIDLSSLIDVPLQLAGLAALSCGLYGRRSVRSTPGVSVMSGRPRSVRLASEPSG